MELIFTYDADTSLTEARRQETKTEADIQRIIDAGKPSKAIKANLVPFANADELDTVEHDWWSLQQVIQTEPDAELDEVVGQDENGNDINRRTEAGERVDQRDELEAEHPHLADYRSATEPARPDVSAPVLAAAKALARKWVNSSRNKALAQPFAYSGVDYDADPASIQNLTATVAFVNGGGSLPAGFTWMSADNTPVSVDAADLQGMAAAAIDQSNSVYQASWDMKAAIDAATDLAGVIAALDDLSA